MAYRRTSRPSIAWINRLRFSSRYITQSSMPCSKPFSEKPGLAPTAGIPSQPNLYRFGLNRHPAQNAFNRIRTPDRSFTIICSVGSLARSAEVLKAESASVRCDVTLDSHEHVPDTESANVRFYPPFDGKPVPAVGTETRMRTDGREEGESEGGESEKSESGVGRGEVYGRGERTRRETRERKLEEKVEAGRWKRGGRGLCKATEEEEAVAMIAEFLREKFGPQIVIKEEGGSINGRIMDQEEDKGRQEEEEEEYGDEETEGSKVEEEDGGEGNEGEDAAVVAKEEVGSPITSPPTRPPPPRNGPRAVSPSSLLSLYRFFSSHLGISSPSIVASLLASHPSLLRSDPTNDFLPRVQLLQSYGVSRADTSAITMKNAYWLRLSLPQVRDMLDFLLARGILRTKLGAVLRKSPYLIGARARSTNLDILVERAGVPVDKLPVIIARGPDILYLREEVIRSRLELLSAYFTNGCEGGNFSSGHPRQHLNMQHKDKNHLSRLLVRYPAILLNPHERIPEILSLLQSFTPPDSPSVAIPILSQAPSLVHLSSQTLLSKLQYFVGVVGKKAAGSVVRSYSSILILSVENMRGKVALLGDLIGRENAVLAVARFPRLLSSSGENIQMCFRELVREVEAAMEESGGEEVRRQMLEEGARKLASGGSGRAFKSIAGATIAHEMVVNLVVKNPAVICYNWEWNTRHKVDYLKRDMGLPVTEVLAYPHFLGYSLDQRIRPRHLALLSKGYVLVPHEVALPNNRGEGGGKLEGVSSERRAEGKDEDVKVDYGEDEGEMDELGVRMVECQSVLDSTQDSSDVLGRTGAANGCGMNQQQGREALCLIQLLKCTDKEFEKRFKVELAPFMPETCP